jgi:hypothetical protein
MPTRIQSDIRPSLYAQTQQSLTPDPFNLQLLNTILRLAEYYRGEWSIFQTAAVTLAANGTSDVIIEPPDGNEEWEILFVMMVDGNSIDNTGDLGNFYLEDAVLNVGIPLNTQTAPGLVNGIGSVVSWPSNTTEVNRWVPGPVNIRIFKNPNGESRFRIKTRWRASATAGNRGLTRRGFYLRRNI